MLVQYVELENKDGTRGHFSDGTEVDEGRADLIDENATIQSLKEFIFPNGGSLGRVAIYIPPEAAGITDWVRKSPTDPLVHNTLYGYIDSRAQSPPPHQNEPSRMAPLVLPATDTQENFTLPATQTRELFKKAKGSDLNDADIDFLYDSFATEMNAIRTNANPRERKRMAGHLWIKASIRIRTQTKLLVRDHYLFDGAIPGAFVNRGTEVQFVLQGTNVYCAKVMSESSSIEREFNVAQRVHKIQSCPTVMQVIETLRLPRDRVAMITPYYALPLSSVSNGLLHEEGCINVALCGLATIKAFSVVETCHGDIKPGNMMLTGYDNRVVMIDFGSAVKYGETITATTPGFALDAPIQGSLSFDLTCLASSIFVLATDKALPRTARALTEALNELQDSTRIRASIQIALACLGSASRGVDKIWEQAQQFVDSQSQLLNQSLTVQPDAMWPVPLPES